MKKLFNKENLLVFTLVLVVLHPLIELDYLAYDFLNSYGLMRLTTIVDYLVLPLIILFTFFLYEKNKKKVLIGFGIYGIVLAIYSLIHIISASSLRNNIHLPDNFIFSTFYELTYILILVLPLIYIWVFYRFEINENLFKKVSLSLGIIFGLSIFIGNLSGFTLATYSESEPLGTIFDWFSLPFNDSSNNPRFYTTKFFFYEGNTTGIMMFINNAFLYYFFLKEDNKFKKLLEGTLVIIHGLAMMMLSTRVAAYGAILSGAMVFVVYIVLVILKIEKVKKHFLIFCACVLIFLVNVFPYSPVYQYHQMDTEVYAEQFEVNKNREELGLSLDEGAEGMVPFSREWLNYYSNAFEAYYFMLGVIPNIYYEDWYPYTEDPKFWVDLIFEYDFYDRTNGRDVQRIFAEYKWQYLNIFEKGFGMGYTTFMNGSLILESDFIQQYYSFGYIGFSLLMMPWFIIALYLAIKLIMSYKKGKWTMFNILLMSVISLTILLSITSGHAMDELTVSLFLALSTGTLWHNLKKEEVYEA